jgi:hypothetical protein
VSWEPEDLKHVLHLDAGVYFVLPKPLAREAFLEAVACLRRIGTPEGEVSAEDFWRRLAGRPRWDKVVPRYRGALSTGEELKRHRATFQTIPNIVQLRGYASFRCGDISVTLDVFNPENELELPYLGGGEPVVVLLLRGLEPGIVHTHLTDREDVYRALRELDVILQPSFVGGIFSWAPLAFAYDDGRLEPSIRPWTFLFQLTTLPENEFPVDDPRARELFRKIERWPRGRLLVQVRGGLEAGLGPEYPRAARLVGRTAVQELVPGAYVRAPARVRDQTKKQ